MTCLVKEVDRISQIDRPSRILSLYNRRRSLQKSEQIQTRSCAILVYKNSEADASEVNKHSLHPGKQSKWNIACMSLVIYKLMKRSYEIIMYTNTIILYPFRNG